MTARVLISIPISLHHFTLQIYFCRTVLQRWYNLEPTTPSPTFPSHWPLLFILTRDDDTSSYNLLLHVILLHFTSSDLHNIAYDYSPTILLAATREFSIYNPKTGTRKKLFFTCLMQERHLSSIPRIRPRARQRYIDWPKFCTNILSYMNLMARIVSMNKMLTPPIHSRVDKVSLPIPLVASATGREWQQSFSLSPFSFSRQWSYYRFISSSLLFPLASKLSPYFSKG